MAVQNNPYRNWFDSRRNSDYRDTTTQIFSLTRQQLSKQEYLFSSNRVNPGPNRRKRTNLADTTLQVPHNFSNEDLWGWQKWADKKYCSVESNLAQNLEEKCDEDDVQYGGVSRL
jgi:hypothetical protein